MHVKTNGGDQGDPSGERPGHRARAGDARVLGRLGRARQRLRRSRDGRHARTASGCRPARSSYLLRRVWLTEEEEKGYYYGFSNEGLWPLCHVAHARPVFRAEDWAHYVSVNRKFADAVCQEVDRDDPIVLVQDYHFAPGAADDPRDAAARHDHHVLAHPVAERRALRHLPVARGADLGHARLEHRRLPHPAPLQQLHRLGRRVHGEPHRSRGERGGAGAAAARWCGRIRSRSSGRCTGSRTRCRSHQCAGRRPARARPGARRAARRRRRSPRLHQGHRGAAAGGRASCCAATRSSAAASPSCSSPRPAAPRSSATAS